MKETRDKKQEEARRGYFGKEKDRRFSVILKGASLSLIK
jgi:hypothetical protein